MTAEPIPDWLRPPPGGFTADDLDRLPDLPPHTELIDASLVLVSPQSRFHSVVIDSSPTDCAVRRRSRCGFAVR